MWHMALSTLPWSGVETSKGNLQVNTNYHKGNNHMDSICVCFDSTSISYLVMTEIRCVHLKIQHSLVLHTL